jgi:hypothetical protein
VEPKIISVNIAMEMYQKYYEDTASTSPKTYFEKINALEYFKAVVGSLQALNHLKRVILIGLFINIFKINQRLIYLNIKV